MSNGVEKHKKMLPNIPLGGYLKRTVAIRRGVAIATNENTMPKDEDPLEEEGQCWVQASSSSMMSQHNSASRTGNEQL